MFNVQSRTRSQFSKFTLVAVASGFLLASHSALAATPEPDAVGPGRNLPDPGSSATQKSVESDSGPTDSVARTASGEARRFGVFVNPIGLLFGVFSGEFDYAVTPNVALTASGSYLDWGIVRGGELGVGPQFFVTEDAYKGVFVSPRIGFSTVGLTDPVVNRSGQTVLFDVSAIGGYEWQFSDGFSLRVGGGLAYYVATSTLDGFDAAAYQGLRPVVDGALGYTF